MFAEIVKEIFDFVHIDWWAFCSKDRDGANAFPFFDRLEDLAFGGEPEVIHGDFLEAGIDILWMSWDNPTMIVTLDAKRRVSIPTALAPATPGDEFDASFDADEDVVTLRRIKRKSNWLAVWKQCPVPMDDLPPRSRERPKKPKL